MLNLAVITLGLVSIISQFILLRELSTSFQGNELALSIIFFSWLLGSGCGALSGRYFLRKAQDSKNYISGLFLFNAMWLPIALSLSRILKPAFSIPVFEIIQPVQIFYISAASIIPFTFVTGLLFVLLCAGLNKPVKVYSLEALGAFLAGALNLFLIKSLTPSYIIWIAAIIFTLSSLIAARKIILTILALFLFCGLLIFPVSGFLNKSQAITNSFRFLPEKLVSSVDSIYANIAVTKTDTSYNLYENGRLYFSTEDKESIENFAHTVLLSHPAPKSILLIGSGISGLVNEILKHPIETIEYIEPDKKLISSALENIPQAKSYGLNNPKLAINNTDARRFLKNSPQKYDLVILNLGDPASLQLNRFFTAEFFKEVRRVLNAQGIFSLSISSKEDILAADMLKYNASIYKTLEREFGNVQIIPGERIILLVSCDKNFGVSPEVLRARYAQRKIQASFFSGEHITAMFLRQQYIFKTLNDALKNIQLNRDYYPAGFLYYLRLWGKQQFFSFAKIWDVFYGLNLFYIAVVFLILGWALRKNTLKFSAASTGFLAIALEIIIIFLFQVNFGLLYYRIGSIVASFMLGLSLGGILSLRLFKKIAREKLLRYLEIILAVTAVLTPYLLGQNELVYYALTLFIGMLAGWEFGIFYKTLDTGSVYALDTLGACLGSLVTGIIFIPVLGIFKTCAAIALLKVIVILFLKKPGH